MIGVSVEWNIGVTNSGSVLRLLHSRQISHIIADIGQWSRIATAPAAAAAGGLPSLGTDKDWRRSAHTRAEAVGLLHNSPYFRVRNI